MDAKEALRYFKEIEFVDLGVDEAGREDPHIVQAREAKQAAISALEKVETLEAENARLREKETPKAIKQRTHNFRGEEVGVCPNNHKVEIYDNYCHICGQKLDWSSDKE